jgi:hypothetical protein
MRFATLAHQTCISRYRPISDQHPDLPRHTHAYNRHAQPRVTVVGV